MLQSIQGSLIRTDDVTAPSKSKKETKINAIDMAGDFSNVLHNQIHKLNTAKQVADHTALQFVKGEGVEPHEVMIASQKAMLGVELTVQVRNKVVEAYQEVMRMQI